MITDEKLTELEAAEAKATPCVPCPECGKCECNYFADKETRKALIDEVKAKRKKLVLSQSLGEKLLRAENNKAVRLFDRITQLEGALREITEMTGPPKMSESMGTAFARIRTIGDIARAVLNGDADA